MKTFYTFLVVAIGSLLVQSCTKEEIIQNNNVEVQVIELTNVNFTPANNYSRLFNFNPAILENDMVLAYWLDVESGSTDVWRMMPQTLYFPGNLEVDYNFDFTRFDVRIFMDSNNFPAIPSNYSTNQIFRVVVLPGYRARSASAVDYSNFDDVVKAYNIDLTKIKRVRL